MRWLKPNLKSIYNILGRPDPVAQPSTATRIEAVRRIMLDAMASAALDIEHREVMRKIRYAGSIQSLWYARSDLMSALAGELGEEPARQRMHDVSHLFKGLLPEARDYRPPRPLR